MLKTPGRGLNGVDTEALFATIDASLNTYFMWLVKSKLVASGLTQYNLVYRFNILMVCISISLDVRSAPLISASAQIMTG